MEVRIIKSNQESRRPRIATQERHASTDRSTPKLDDSRVIANPPKSEAKAMKEGIKFVNDQLEIVESVVDYLSNSNVNYNIVSAIGPQGAGKSTILSMLAGNNSRHMYREYVFRPVSREANELSRHQTEYLEIFKFNNTIFIDCQPINSYSLCKIKRGSSKSFSFDDTTEKTSKLLSFLYAISHTVIVCSETVLDMNLIKIIRTAELLRPNLTSSHPSISETSSRKSIWGNTDIQFVLDRKVNLFFLQTKAKSIDYDPSVIENRERLLRAIFKDSRRFKLSKDKGKVLIPLKEVNLRKEELIENIESSRFNDEKYMKEFDREILKIKQILFNGKESFTVDVNLLTEKMWFEMCKRIWSCLCVYASQTRYDSRASDFDSKMDFGIGWS